MSGLLKDLLYAYRTLLKSPGFTIVSLLTLAIAIGANTAIFSFVDSILLKPLPYPEADKIVRVLEKPPGNPRNGISTLNFLDWRKQNSVFDFMAAQAGADVTLTGYGEPVQLRGVRVSPQYFDIFGVKAGQGRLFTADEEQRGNERKAVLSHLLWVSRFGGDPKLLGRTIHLDSEPYIVVGILPEGSAFDREYGQIWMPLAFKPEQMTRNFHWFAAYGKLKPGVTLDRARAQMDTIGARIAHDYPDSNKGWGVVVERYADILVPATLRTSLYVLLSAVGMILLIGCANLANLTLSRGAARERELAVRSALGASRSRLIRQFLTENMLLSVAGGVLGVAVGYATMAALRAAVPPFSLPSETNVGMDYRVLLFALAISVATGIIFGLVPAFGATKVNFAESLKEGARGTTGGRGRLRSALVIAEVALAFMLLTGAGLLIRSFFQMQQAEMGFETTNILTAGLPLNDKSYPEPDQLRAFLRQTIANIQAIPGVRDVAFASTLPLQGWGYGMPFQISGRPLVDRPHRPACFFKMVSPAYFRTIGMHIRKGRALSDRDLAGADPVAVVNETMVKKFFPGEDPIGKRILIAQVIPGKPQLGPEVPWEIVGVVADERVNNLDGKDDSPGMYVTSEQSPVYFGGLVIRASTNPAGLEKAVRKAVSDVNSDQPMADFKTLEAIKAESMVADRLRSLLLGVFAGIALLLSAVGIYGVISYSVARRTGELGIRAALGASRRSLLNLILLYGLSMTGTGLAIGLAAAFGLTRFLASLLYGIGAWDPLTIAIVAGLLAAVALLACYIPARRATKVDPMVALRYE
ncbi:MAG TPA: ABC transporter permease [Bryobacteraceae bacterium]|jgi:putative ABC transport system permease protein|nr:ABC transporter permease [Bryobacteraceae bacterium]